MPNPCIIDIAGDSVTMGTVVWFPIPQMKSAVTKTGIVESEVFQKMYSDSFVNSTFGNRSTIAPLWLASRAYLIVYPLPPILWAVNNNRLPDVDATLSDLASKAERMLRHRVAVLPLTNCGTGDCVVSITVRITQAVRDRIVSRWYRRQFAG
jgi:hypothetical protein